MKLSFVAEVTEKFGCWVAARDPSLWASANSDSLTLWQGQTPTRSVQVPGCGSGSLLFHPNQEELLLAPFRFNLNSQQWTPPLMDLRSTLINALATEEAIDGQLEILRAAYSPEGNELWVATYIRPPRRRGKSRSGTRVKPCVFRLDGQRYHILDQMLSGKRIDGCLLISSSYAALANNTLWLFDRQNLTLQAEFEGHRTRIEQLAFSRDGRYLASGSTNGQIGIWNLPDCRSIKLWSVHTGSVTGLQFLPQNSDLISVGDDGQIKLWSCTLEEMEPVVILEQTDPIQSMTLDASGKRLIIAIESDIPRFQLFDIEA